MHVVRGRVGGRVAGLGVGVVEEEAAGLVVEEGVGVVEEEAAGLVVEVGVGGARGRTGSRAFTDQTSVKQSEKPTW